MVQTIPVTVMALESVLIPVIVAPIEARNAATDNQNFLLFSFMIKNPLLRVVVLYLHRAQY